MINANRIGLVRGKSAYESAIATGEFVGTEAEWVRSLRPQELLLLMFDGETNFSSNIHTKNNSAVKITGDNITIYLTPPAVTTAERNATDFEKVVGLEVFDTTLGKPIWYNGTRWIDATGSSV